MAKAVQLGAGNIGRGFLGQLLFEGGYGTTFVDADAALVRRLNAREEYPLRLVSDAGEERLTIRNLRALDARDAEAVVEAVAGADLVSTAVGVGSLPRLAPALAAGISLRAEAGGGPLNVLLCENQWHAAAMVRGLIEPHLAPAARAYFDGQVGLVETVIGRMVPRPTDAVLAEDPLLVVAEPYKELPIARAMVRGAPPTLPGLILADDFEAYEARKLFLHNMGHAGLAYLGYRRGHTFIWQCAEDPEVAAICREALSQVAAAIEDRYGLPGEALAAFNADLMHRFANRALGDTVARVAGDPLRKLRPDDRLVGAASLCLEHGQTPAALARVIAAALEYNNPEDPAAVELQRRRESEGDEAVLRSICGIAPESELGALVRAELAPV